MSEQVKLKWETGNPRLGSMPLPEWVADGKMSSYSILYLPIAGKYQVRKLRQPSGQIVDERFALTLEGAQARAQVWEDGS